MAKQILVTQRNLHLINYRLQQFLKRHQCVSMQGFYRYATTTRYNQMMKPKDAIDCAVEKTQVSYMLVDDAEFEVIRKDNCEEYLRSYIKEIFIRIHYAYDSCIHTIEPGDKIAFAPNRITINKKHPTREGERMLDVWMPADSAVGRDFAYVQKAYADDYYSTCDEEYEKQQTERELKEEGFTK